MHNFARALQICLREDNDDISFLFGNPPNIVFSLRADYEEADSQLKTHGLFLHPLWHRIHLPLYTKLLTLDTSSKLEGTILASG
jgi:hypothetical protein